jgi:hypothetical protein
LFREELEAKMQEKNFLVRVFNNLQDQDISTWKNIDRGHKQVVQPGGGPADFLYEQEEPRKELKITADPLKNNKQRALLKISLSSASDFTVTVQLKQEEKKDKWVVGFLETISPSDIVIVEDPPVVNVSVGEDEDPDILSRATPK